ncbi:MAG: GNAT family N-acetyltransferase [Muribaculaceae bacterium]|nr:GNAT family N-acetyltransferase [Muribaculaceae bacterium]
MITLRRYTPADKAVWNAFIEGSKNGTFLHNRDYMDYHSDRFHDFSLMVFKGDRLLGLLPACISEGSWVSHAGLTYGGLIADAKCTATDTLEIFRMLRVWLSESGFDRIVYSPTPHIYHRLPSEEDLYALFREGAVLSTRKIASVVNKENRLKWRNIRKAGVRKARKEEVIIDERPDFEQFWKVLENNLKGKYGASPVHSEEEIVRLHGLFPDNILLHTASLHGETVGGVVIYRTPEVAHCQYISANEEGKATGALDLLFHHLLDEVYYDVPYFDFGTSNEDGGRYLNESLIYQKEGFGARAVCYDSYTITLNG